MARNILTKKVATGILGELEIRSTDVSRPALRSTACGGSVVITASEDSNFVLLNLIHKTMFLIDAPGPTAAQFVFQRLGFAQARERVALRFSNQANDTDSLSTILFHPPGKILEGRRIKFQASQRQSRMRVLPGVA